MDQLIPTFAGAVTQLCRVKEKASRGEKGTRAGELRRPMIVEQRLVLLGHAVYFTYTSMVVAAV